MMAREKVRNTSLLTMTGYYFKHCYVLSAALKFQAKSVIVNEIRKLTIYTLKPFCLRLLRPNPLNKHNANIHCTKNEDFL